MNETFGLLSDSPGANPTMGWRRDAGLATINRRLVLGVSAVGETQLGAVGL